MKSNYPIIAACIALLLIPALATAQGVGRQAGTVEDEEGNPLEGVSVTIKDTEESTMSDAEGRWRFARLEAPKEYVFVFEKEGYVTHNITKRVMEGPSNRPFTATMKELVLTPEQEAYQYYQEANELMQQRQFEQALELYERAIQLQPEETAYQFSAGVSLYFLNEYRNALDFFEPIAADFSDNPAALTLIGDSYFYTKKYESAVDYYQKLQELGAADVNSTVNLGYALHQTDKPEEALVVYDTAISMSPENTDPYQRKAVIFLEQDRADDAINSLMKIYEIEGEGLSRDVKNTLVTLLEEKGNALLEAGKSEEAIPYFEKIIMVAPDTEEATNAEAVIETAKEMGGQ